MWVSMTTEAPSGPYGVSIYRHRTESYSGHFKLKNEPKFTWMRPVLETESAAEKWRAGVQKVDAGRESGGGVS